MWRMWYIAGVSYIVYLCFMVVDVIVALYSTGPVVAVMETSSDFKIEYRCGVFCFGSRTDSESNRLHAVEIVDYGTTSSGINFWVAKNSWGSRWGEDGYFRIVQCFILLCCQPVSLCQLVNLYLLQALIT